jgi:hypothetical protein
MVFLAALFLGSCPGCGTGIGKEEVPIKSVLESMNGQPVVPREANRIWIPPFAGGAGTGMLGQRLALRLREYIAMDGRLAVVNEGKHADLVLNGTVLLYQVQPLAYDDLGVPVKKRIRMVASCRLLDIPREKVIFNEAEIQAFEIFSDTVPPLVTEESARERIMESLARRIALQTVSGWYTELMTPVEKVKRR